MFETVRIHFLRDDLICCRLEICYHGNVTQLLLLSFGDGFKRRNQEKTFFALHFNKKIEGKRPFQRPK